MPFNREVFFDHVRKSLFAGKLTQQQVDGMNGILRAWESEYAAWDLRWLAYAMATAKHETASTMWPIEEYGKGSGQPYGEKDPVTGYAYYGRGLVQLTWADNYKKADKELGLEKEFSTYWNPINALNAAIASEIMFVGMYEGWFRKKRFLDYFSDTKDDPYNAREIINGDKTYKPSWAKGQTIGNIIAGYHKSFLEALKASWSEPVPVAPEPIPEEPSSRNYDELWDLVEKIAALLGITKGDKPNA